MKKDLPFHVLDNFDFLFLHPLHISRRFPYIIKDVSSEADFGTAWAMRDQSWMLSNVVYLVLYLDLWDRKCCIVICIVIVNAILVVQRRIDWSSHRRFSIKKESLQISQNSQENTCARVSSLRDSITGFFLWISRDL